MRCIRPLKAGRTRSGDITYSKRLHDPNQAAFQFECRKCLPCRLNIAREKAIRAIHESKVHEDNIFLTLTYDENHIKDGRLHYEDFQNFMKKLRKITNNQIGYMVTGEYGDKTKRPHWHAIIFNYAPKDPKHLYTSDLGEKNYTSETLQKLWPHGQHQYGSVTMESAGYVARYAAKKLTHGKDQDHNYHPIHKTSSKHALGKKWIESNYKHTFENGFIVLPNGHEMKIPRYYVTWCEKHQPELYKKYKENIVPKIIKKAEEQQRKEELDHYSEIINAESIRGCIKPLDRPLTRSKVKETILKLKFKRLLENLKL